MPNPELARVAELRAALARAEAGRGEAESREARLPSASTATPLAAERAGGSPALSQAGAARRERQVAERTRRQGELARLGPRPGDDGASVRAGALGGVSGSWPSIEARLDRGAGAIERPRRPVGARPWAEPSGRPGPRPGRGAVRLRSRRARSEAGLFRAADGSSRAVTDRQGGDARVRRRGVGRSRISR